MGLVAFSVCNVGGLTTALVRQEQPINPILVAIVALVVLASSRFRASELWLSVLTLSAYTVLGFITMRDPLAIANRDILTMLGRLWISFVVIPWILQTALSDKAKLLSRLIVCIVFAGAVFAIAQSLGQRVDQRILQQPGRGAGFWIGPNDCGALCLLALLANGLFPFGRRLANVLVLVTLSFGLVSTMSRAALLAAGISTQWYLLARGRARTAISVGFVAVALWLSIPYVLEHLPVEAADQPARVQSMIALAHLNLEGTRELDTRGTIWLSALEAIMQSPVVGLGLGSMDYIVNGVTAPHNFYLYVWGNGGVLSLAFYLALWVYSLIRIQSVCDQRIRAALGSLWCALMCLFFFDGALPSAQYIAPFIAIVMSPNFFRSSAPERVRAQIERPASCRPLA